VNISTVSSVKSPYMRGTPDDMFRKFFEDFLRQHGGSSGNSGDDEDDDQGPPPGSTQKAMALGTGFIIDKDGLILTNNHVVADADEIKINFTEEAEEKPTDGEVVGRDPELDLALIKVKSKREMKPITLGDSDSVEVGEYVMAVGQPFGQGHSVSHGIISAKERDAPDFVLARYLQTDAPINPGNSGGPLVNLKGEVIGINNAIYQGAQGIGFAIPINLVKKVLDQLRTKGTVSRGYIGVLVNDMTPEIAEKFGLSKDLHAPFVTHVYPGEPADKAGLKPYDVITEFNGKKIHTMKDLVGEVTAVEVGKSVPIHVKRGKDEKTLTIKVSQRPTTPNEAPAKPKKKKNEKKPKHLDIGADLEDISPDMARDLGVPPTTVGVVVVSTAYGGPADQAGLVRGDIIVEVDRKPVKSQDAFFKIVKTKKSYLLRVRRGDPQGRDVYTVVVLDLK
jgi:serine protease Do